MINVSRGSRSAVPMTGNMTLENYTLFPTAPRILGSHHSISVYILPYSPAEVGMNPEIFYKVYFLIDFDSPESTLSESAGCTKCTLERFEKFKMASKMAAIIAWMTLFAISTKFR